MEFIFGKRGKPKLQLEDYLYNLDKIYENKRCFRYMERKYMGFIFIYVTNNILTCNIHTPLNNKIITSGK